MKLTLLTKGFEPVDEYRDLRSITAKKYAKLERYFHGDVSVELVIKFEHDFYKAEVTVPYGGYVFRVEETNEDAYSAANVALDKLERQIIKYKSRFKDKFRSADFDDIPVSDEYYGTDDISSEIVKHKTYSTKPMTEEEAIIQLELTDRDFYVFVNGATFQTNVVYKRKDGKYGIIEPVS